MDTTKWETIPGPTTEDKLVTALAQMVTAPTMREFYEARAQVDELTEEGQYDSQRVDELKAHAWEMLVPEWHDYSQSELRTMMEDEA